MRAGGWGYTSVMRRPRPGEPPVIYDARRRDAPAPEPEPPESSAVAGWTAIGAFGFVALISLLAPFVCVVAGVVYAVDCLSDAACSMTRHRHGRGATADFEGAVAILMGGLMAAIALLCARLLGGGVAGLVHRPRAGEPEADPPASTRRAFTAVALVLGGAVAWFIAR